MTDIRRQRAELRQAIQDVLAEHEDGALLSGFFLVAEMHRPDGDTFLAYRSGNLNDECLTSWQGLGYLHSAVQAVEQQTWETSVDVEDDDGD